MKNVFTLLSLLLTITTTPLLAAERENCSKVNGVQLGAITYSYRSMGDQSIEAILDYTVASGVSSVELMGDVVESYLGVIPTKGDATTSLRANRANLSMERVREIKEMFDSRGVEIHALKLGNLKWSDEEIDYAFEVCKALGAYGITMEISDEAAARFAPFAERHEKYVIFHNHLQSEDPSFSYEKALSYSKYMKLNFDAGHYYGATGINPCRFVERMHERIFSIHVKDKTGKFDPEPNVNQSFGKGSTPVVELLQLIRDNRYPIFCDIELEYTIPKSSDAVKEVKKTIAYCKSALKE